MADKKIQFSVVANGIPTIRNELKSVSESARSMYLNIAQYEERASLRIVQMEREKAASIARINASVVLDESKKQAKIIEIEERTARRIKALHENRDLRSKQVQERFALQNSQEGGGGTFNAINDLMSRAGLNKASEMMNLGKSLGIGSEAGAAGGAEGLAALGAAALPAAAAIGAIAVASKLVEIGFQNIVKETTYVASAFLGAATEIGGFKDLQGMIVDASKNQRSAAQIAAVAESAGVAPSEIERKVRSARQGTEFSEADMLEAFGKYQARTGQMMSPEVAKHMATIASVNNTKLSQTADVYGQLKLAYPNLSDRSLMDITQKVNKIGINGSVEFTDANQLSGTVAKAGNISGSADVTVPKLIGYAQLYRGATGSASEASTVGERLIEEITKNKGHKFNVSYDKEGKISNFDQLLEDAVVQKRLHPEITSKFKSSESIQGINAIANRVTGNTEEEIRTSFRQVVDSATNVNMSLEELHKRLQPVTETVDYQLKKLAGDIEEAFGPSLISLMSEDVVPAIKVFGQALMENKDSFIETMKAMINVIIAGIPAAMMAGKALLGLGVATAYLTKAFAETVRFFANTIPGLSSIVDGKLGELSGEATRVIDSQTSLWKSFDKLATSVEELSAKMKNVSLPGKTTERPWRAPMQEPGGWSIPMAIPEEPVVNVVKKQVSEQRRTNDHLGRKAVR